MANLLHEALDLILRFGDSRVGLSLDCRLLGELAAHGAGTARKCGLRRDSVGGHKLRRLDLDRKQSKHEIRQGVSDKDRTL